MFDHFPKLCNERVEHCITYVLDTSNDLNTKDSIFGKDLKSKNFLQSVLFLWKDRRSRKVDPVTISVMRTYLFIKKFYT